MSVRAEDCVVAARAEDCVVAGPRSFFGALRFAEISRSQPSVGTGARLDDDRVNQIERAVTGRHVFAGPRKGATPGILTCQIAERHSIRLLTRPLAV